MRTETSEIESYKLNAEQRARFYGEENIRIKHISMQVLGWGAIICGIAAFVVALPQFTIPFASDWVYVTLLIGATIFFMLGFGSASDVLTYDRNAFVADEILIDKAEHIDIGILCFLGDCEWYDEHYVGYCGNGFDYGYRWLGMTEDDILKCERICGIVSERAASS